MLGQVSMPCVLRIKGSLFCPATFLEVTGLFWLQLLRTLRLNSGHTTSAQKVHRHKSFLSNEVQCVEKLQIPPKVNHCFFPLRSGILNLHVRIPFDLFLPFLLELSHSLFFFFLPLHETRGRVATPRSYLWPNKSSSSF